jgi:tetratricopeptide (TPR) repeat protein
VVNALGLLALAHLRQGNTEQALEIASYVVDHIGRSAPIGYVAFGGYMAPAEVFLKVWETSNDKSYAKPARQDLGQLKRYTRRFPIGEPRFLLLRGCYAWLSGNHRRANRLWQQAIKRAQELGMFYEMALARYEIGRHHADDDERRKHIQQAAVIFDQLGATYHADEARNTLMANTETA